MLKRLFILGLACAGGFAAASVAIHYLTPASEQHVSPITFDPHSVEGQSIENRGLSEEQLKEILRAHAYKHNTVSGHYLAGRFAQHHHDWKEAGKHIKEVLNKTGNDDLNLMKRAMVLSMGAGEYDRAFELAKILHDQKSADVSDGALTLLLLSIESYKDQDYEAAAKAVFDMPIGSLSNFIMPLLKSWSHAALGSHDTLKLNKSSVHIYHAIMIADFMGQHDHIELLLDQALRVPSIGIQDLERIADIYAHIGKAEQARELYEEIQTVSDENPQIADKLEKIKAGQPQKIFEKVETPEQGIARALLDMAQILAQEYSDESARVFAHMAIYLDPDLTDAKFLLARIAVRNEQTAEAVSYYKTIAMDEGSEDYLKARRMVAEILEEEGNKEAALKELRALYDEYQDIESLLQIGNIYRRAEEFEQAVENYNKAAQVLGEEIPQDYWHLHYVRGMAYEQMDEWDAAEKDLLAALEYQPDHPFILNYLGYAWADQGIKLDQALELIKKAVDLRPSDGYITDSLGWVLYRMNRFEDAVPYLELAVELMPYDPVVNDHLGDAYWRVGRKLEAKFQWTRAKNHSEEEELRADIDDKLINGLSPINLDAADIQAAELKGL